MRRLLALLILITSMLVTLSATDMVIRAFKIGSSGVTVHFNDRISQTNIADGSRINLTPRLNDLLGSTVDLPKSFTSYVIFSYRVEGNETGAYTMSFDISDFSTATSDGSYHVDTVYQLGNLNAVFSNGTWQEHTAEAATGEVINYTDETSTVKSSKATSGVNALLSTSWTVSSDANSTATSGQSTNTAWIARGAVGAIIDNSFTDSETPYGEYTATVKATLSVK